VRFVRRFITNAAISGLATTRLSNDPSGVTQWINSLAKSFELDAAQTLQHFRHPMKT
jgi:hypothetical protein